MSVEPRPGQFIVVCGHAFYATLVSTLGPDAEYTSVKRKDGKEYLCMGIGYFSLIPTKKLGPYDVHSMKTRDEAFEFLK